MKFHDQLNPKLWNKFELKEEVKDKLEEIAQAFIDYLNIPNEAIIDIRITGSSANYNYTKHSDLDLHLIIDYEKVHEECPIVEGYLWSMKSAFNKEHDISIYGIDVEVYAENSRQQAVSNGVYSLFDDEWIRKPEKIEPTNNDAAVLAKYNEIKDAVEKLNDSEEAELLLDKIYEMRKAGLTEQGEFSVENLAFKMLRNEGIMDRLKDIKKKNIDKQLTLESFETLDRYKLININDYNKAIKAIDDIINSRESISKTEYGQLARAIARTEKEAQSGAFTINTERVKDKAKMQRSQILKLYKNRKNESMNKSEELKVGDIVNWNNVVWVKINSIDGNKANVSPIYKKDIDSGKFEKEEIVLLNSLRKSNESIKEGFNKGDKVQLKRKNNKIGIVKSIFNGDRDKNGKDIKYLDVEFEDGTKEGRPASDFKKINESIKEEVTVDSYLKMLRDGGHLFDKKDAEYLVQCFNDKKLEVLAEYKDVEKAAQRFLDCCNKYDKVVFKQLSNNGKEIKVIDTDTKELNKKPLFMEHKMDVSKAKSVNESNKKYRSVVADDKYTRYKDFFGRRGRKRTLHVKPTGQTLQFLSGPKAEYKDIKTGGLFYLADGDSVMTDKMGEPYTKFEIISESIKESLQDEYKQAFDLLMEGENIVGTLNTDFGKQFVKDVESLYEIKSYKLKLRKAKDLLIDIYGYLIDEQFDDYNRKIIKFINNSKNESISHLKNLQRLLETTINKCL